MADLNQFSDDELKTAHAVTQVIDGSKGSPDLSHFSDDQLKTAQRVTQVIDQSQAASPKEQPSMAASGARQALSGFAGNFDDELSGAVGAAGRVAGMKNLGTWKPFNPDSHLETASPTIDPSELAKSYQENRDVARNEQHQDIAAHPVISTAANVAGMIANPALRALTPAGMGAVQGAGNSDAQDIGGVAKDTVIGAGVGYAGGKLAEGASGLLAPRLQGAAESLAERATGAPEAAQGIGRELLDKGMVGFGDTQPQIAAKLGEAPAPKNVFDPFTKKPSTIGTDFGGVANAAKSAKPAPSSMDYGVDLGLAHALMSGHPLAAAAGYAAKKVALPRVTSSLASTANGLSQALESNPQAFGKWAPALSKAAARGEVSLNAAAYVLQQQDPEFRQKMQDLGNQDTSSLSQKPDGQ